MPCPMTPTIQAQEGVELLDHRAYERIQEYLTKEDAVVPDDTLNAWLMMLISACLRGEGIIRSQAMQLDLFRRAHKRWTPYLHRLRDRKPVRKDLENIATHKKEMEP